jgi:hypothetical protein
LFFKVKKIRFLKTKFFVGGQKIKGVKKKPEELKQNSSLKNQNQWAKWVVTRSKIGMGSRIKAYKVLLQ